MKDVYRIYIKNNFSESTNIYLLEQGKNHSMLFSDLCSEVSEKGIKLFSKLEEELTEHLSSFAKGLRFVRTDQKALDYILSDPECLRYFIPDFESYMYSDSQLKEKVSNIQLYDVIFKELVRLTKLKIDTRTCLNLLELSLNTLELEKYQDDSIAYQFPVDIEFDLFNSTLPPKVLEIALEELGGLNSEHILPYPLSVGHSVHVHIEKNKTVKIY